MKILRAAHSEPEVLKDSYRIMNELPSGLVADFVDLYRKKSRGTRSTKYYNLPVYLTRAVWQAHQLGLNKEPWGQRIVDLGTGFGYFPLVCNKMGHTAAGLDHYRKKVYQDIDRYISMDRITWIVSAEEPLPPELGYSLDLVTAFSPTFYYDYENERLWDVGKWRRFLGEMREHLEPGGRLYIDSNTLRDGQKDDYVKMSEYFRSLGAKMLQNGWLFSGSQLPTR